LLISEKFYIKEKKRCASRNVFFWT